MRMWRGEPKGRKGRKERRGQVYRVGVTLALVKGEGDTSGMHGEQPRTSELKRKKIGTTGRGRDERVRARKGREEEGWRRDVLRSRWRAGKGKMAMCSVVLC